MLPDAIAPAVILIISVSGPMENVAGAIPFTATGKYIVPHELTLQNIASLRIDKLGMFGNASREIAPSRNLGCVC